MYEFFSASKFITARAWIGINRSILQILPITIANVQGILYVESRFMQLEAKDWQYFFEVILKFWINSN